MEIRENDKKYTAEETGIIDRLTKEVMDELDKSSIVYIYKRFLWNAESYHRVVGGRFKEKGYYVAYDYVPNGYRNMVVSKMPIGHPSGRLVTRSWM